VEALDNANPFTLAAVTALGGLLASVVSNLLAARQSRRREVMEAERGRLFRQETQQELRERLTELGANAEEVERALVDLGSPPVTGGTQPSKEEIRQEVESAVNAIRDRIERVEQRFPEESTLDKIASANDAILATKIEFLEKSIANLESRMLTKWDVVTVAFAVLAAIGGLAGAAIAITNFVTK